MIQFSLFGIPIVVQPFFWLSMALIGGAFSATTPQAILSLLLFVIAGFISILVHELGHALTARRYRQNVAIVLHAFGGYAAYQGPPLSRTQNFLITAAGPAIQMVLGLMGLAILIFAPLPETQILSFVESLTGVSIIWAVFNLLPILPMDGGRLLESVLGPNRIKVTLMISLVTAVAIVIAGIFFRLWFVAIFVGMMAHQSFQALKERKY